MNITNIATCVTSYNINIIEDVVPQYIIQVSTFITGAIIAFLVAVVFFHAAFALVAMFCIKVYYFVLRYNLTTKYKNINNIKNIEMESV